MLRQVENAVGLSYGTISDVSNFDKTAEEIRSSKQRSFSRVRDIQESLKAALTALAYGMQYYTDYQTSSVQKPPAELSCDFGDGVLEDWEKTFTRRFQLVSAGLLKPEYVITDEFSCTVEDARKMIPNSSLESSGNGLFGDA